MSTVALKRGAAPPRRKPVAARKPAPATLALPVSAPTLRRNVGMTAAGLVLLATAVVTSLMGIPQRAWQDFVRQTADAGYEIRHVEINGAEELSRLAVYDAALSGPTNAMLAADLHAIRDRLLAMPWVADASVARRLPDTLAITIVERKPAALWQHRQRFAAVDVTGRVLTTRNLERYASLPVVVGPGANLHVRELLMLTAAAPALSAKVDAAVLVGGRRWDVKFKTGETLALPDTPAAATAAFKKFASLDAGEGDENRLLGGRFERFDMRLPGQMTVGGPAVQKALEEAAKAAKAAKTQKPTTI
ncbi:MAG: cell division protein FtsQ [Alphaproteobacteria bacterium]|nr:MAG: cell division protein FtsQ [Alphaproteobacteria bacterium]